MIQHIKGVDHIALLTFLLTKHINSYDNVFLKEYFLLVTCGVFSPDTKSELILINFVFCNVVIRGKSMYNELFNLNSCIGKVFITRTKHNQKTDLIEPF